MNQNCCLKSCAREIAPDDARVEIHANTKKTGQNFMIQWGSGRTFFHRPCWFVARTEAIRRAAKRSAKGAFMPSVEKKYVLQGEETAEFFDSISDIEKKSKLIASRLKQANHTVIFSGAGISTSAGIGDYRGPDGKWTKDEQKRDDDDESEGVDYPNLRPSYSHEAIKNLVDRGCVKYVISQNCDGLHILSGVPSDKISELHGDCFLEICNDCGKNYMRSYYVCDDEADVGITGAHVEECPTCQLNHFTGRNCTVGGCGGKLRDSIINFGDQLDPEIMGRAQQHAEKCDLMISLGSSMSVTPASNLAKQNRKNMVIVNRQPTEFDKSARVRVFGDIDNVMKLVMADLMSDDEYIKWVNEVKQRHTSDFYTKQRSDNPPLIRPKKKRRTK